VTDREGHFVLDFDSTLFDRNKDGRLDPSEGRLVVEGGVDLASGQPRVGQLTAPTGSEVITPLTTMVDLVSRQGDGLSTSEAEERVRSALGIPAGISMTSYDPVAAAVQGDSRAASVQLAASSIADTIGLLANVIDGASGSADANQSSAMVSQVLASQLVAGTAVDLSSTETLGSTLTVAAANVGTSLSSEVTSTVSQVVSEQNSSKIEAVANAWNPLDALKSIAQVQAVSQTGTSTAMNDLGAGIVSTDEVNLLYTGSALSEAIAAAPVGDVTSTDRRPGVFEVSTATAVFTESGRSIQPLIVARHDGAYGAVRLLLRLEGDADLLVTNVITLDFADAVTQQAVDLSSVLRDDLDPQADRLVSVSLGLSSDVPSGTSLGSQKQGMVRVVDNDAAGSIGFVASRFQATEGGPVSVELRRLDGTAGKIVAVLRLYGGTAAAGQDYPSSVITVEFLPGQARKVVSLGWVDDGTVESMESVNVVLEIGAGSASGSALVVGASETVIEVDDKYVLPASNTAPRATGVSSGTDLTVGEGMSINLTLQGTDAEGAKLSFIPVSAPSKGVLSGRAPNLIYKAYRGSRGSDSFAYKVNDGQLDSELATVTVAIQPVNLAPEAASQNLTTDEDQPIGLRLAGTDPDGDLLTFRVVANPQKGKLSGVAPNLIYSPNPDVSGVDSFTFRANDGTLESPETSVRIAIKSVNDAPAVRDFSVTTAEHVPVKVELLGSDADGDKLTYSVVSMPMHGQLTGSGSDWVYVSEWGFSGTDRFTYKANDGFTDSSVRTVTIQVPPFNRTPVAGAFSVATDEDTAILLKLMGLDPEGSNLTYTVVRQPSNGVLSGEGAARQYVPNQDFNGTDRFTYRVSDGELESGLATVTIRVSPVNDSPIALAQSLKVTQGASVAVTLVGYDVDKDFINYKLVSMPKFGKLSGSGANWIYQANDDATGSDTFTYRVNDGFADSGLVSVRINIGEKSTLGIKSSNGSSITLEVRAPIAAVVHLESASTFGVWTPTEIKVTGLGREFALPVTIPIDRTVSARFWRLKVLSSP